MRTIKRTGQFKRDFKREIKGRYSKVLQEEFATALTLLVNNEVLPARYFDHPLTGNWSDHRDCHLKPDLILIYRLPDDDAIELVRLGSHSELGLA
jgi:mRNA interferase YafQ